MTEVLILEDEDSSREALVKILCAYSPDIRVHASATFEEAKALLVSEIRFSLFLLDVNLSGSDREDIGGILFAREVRERFCYSFTPIVMVTSIGAMEMQAYREIHCYQYLMKPFQKQQVEEILRRVLDKENQEKPPVVTVKKDGISYQVRCEDICYIEAVPRGICLHMKKEIWKVPYVTLRQILQKLPRDMFVQCHRMYVVNMRDMEYYDPVNRIVKLKSCADSIEVGATYKTEFGRLVL